MAAALPLALADAAVGTALLAGGGILWKLRPKSRTGLIMAGTGICWFAGSLVGAAVFLHRGPLVHLHISYPTGRLRRPIAVGTVAVAYAVSLFDLVAANSWVTLGLALFVAIAAVDVFTRTSGPARKAGGPALGAALAFAGVLALSSANRLLGWDADLAVLLTYDAVVCLVAVVLVADLLWGRWSDATVADLVTVLGRRAGTEGLRGQLQRALGDPSLDVGFWIPEQGRYVDDAGRPLDVPVGDERRAVTRIDDHGQPLALLVHDAVALDDPALVDGVASAARLAVANAGMQAEVRERVAELAASRRRIVEAADTQRRRLELELASGAEQRLQRIDRLLDAFEREVAEVGAESVELRGVRAEVSGARADLREFAQGVRPAALGAGGLRAALPLLAARATVPVTVAVRVGRLPPAVESAIFFICSEALANVAKHAEATSASMEVSMELRDDADEVVVTVLDDGVGGADPRGSGLRGLADRVEALGGTMVVSDQPVAGTRLTAVVPVGSGTGGEMTR